MHARGHLSARLPRRLAWPRCRVRQLSPSPNSLSDSAERRRHRRDRIPQEQSSRRSRSGRAQRRHLNHADRRARRCPHDCIRVGRPLKGRRRQLAQCPRKRARRSSHGGDRIHTFLPSGRATRRSFPVARGRVLGATVRCRQWRGCRTAAVSRLVNERRQGGCDVHCAEGSEPQRPSATEFLAERMGNPAPLEFLLVMLGARVA